MKVAIVGFSGYISEYLLQRFGRETYIDTVKIGHGETADFFLELQTADRFDYSVLEGIDYVIFTAAISGPDKCASEYDLCWRVNVTGTMHFIQEAIKRKCRVIFFSSDAVYGSYSTEIYTENSLTKARTPYGKMKKEVEDRFAGDSYFKSMRLSYVFSAKDRFISYCLSCIESGMTAEIFHPFYRNVICVDDVVNVVVWLVKNWDFFPPAVLNLAGKELISRVRMADEVDQILGGKLNYKIVKPDKSFYDNRPQITQMKSLFLYSDGILEESTFTEKMKNILDNYSK